MKLNKKVHTWRWEKIVDNNASQMSIRVSLHAYRFCCVEYYAATAVMWRGGCAEDTFFLYLLVVSLKVCDCVITYHDSHLKWSFLIAKWHLIWLGYASLTFWIINSNNKTLFNLSEQLLVLNGKSLLFSLLFIPFWWEQDYGWSSGHEAKRTTYQVELMTGIFYRKRRWDFIIVFTTSKCLLTKKFLDFYFIKGYQ